MTTTRSGWLLTSCVALGAALLVLAIVPAAWPNPLGGERATAPVEVPANEAIPPLMRAAFAVDAACDAGDARAFAAATTASWRGELRRGLAVVDADLDGTTLRGMFGSAGLSSWLDEPVLAVRVHDQRAAVAVLRPDGDGAQVLRFTWDGFRFRCDGVSHALRVRDVEGARRHLDGLLAP
ncbi:MAG: hypothetical protein H6835_13860 [Planctomycetes bacterium]|nr:hypothetical protein [Planctomycetota bacterium]